MSDFYYFLDGTETGPISREAIEGLIRTGHLNEALFRQSAGGPWQTASEVGLSVQKVTGMPRQPRESKGTSSKNVRASLLVLFLGLIGLFLYQKFVTIRLPEKTQPTNVALPTASLAPSTSKLSDAQTVTYPSNNAVPISTIGEVLTLARKFPVAALSTDLLSEGECSCSISGNSVEVDASTRLYLYKDGASYVVVLYREDNHGNPSSGFYRFNGSSWADVGADVMPGYSGGFEDYLEATSNGITKWRGSGEPQTMYVYRDGRFAVSQ